MKNIKIVEKPAFCRFWNISGSTIFLEKGRKNFDSKILEMITNIQETSIAGKWTIKPASDF